MQSGHLLYNNTLKSKKKKHRVAARCLRDDKSTDPCTLPCVNDIVPHPVSVCNTEFVSRKVKKRRLSDIDVIIIDGISTFYIRKD